MKLKLWSAMTLTFLILASAGMFYSHEALGQDSSGWVTLFDGSNLDNWNTIGNANWKLADGVVQADQGNGYLVSKNSYENFELRVEIWVDADANSGVFLRCSDPEKITAANAYEGNVFDKRPDPTYGTGAIVNVSKAATVIKAGGHWNTYDITADGTHFVVILNGTETVNVENGRHSRGHIGLQYAAGVVKFRKVQIKPL
jgi:3-keto-disaccharide hydrolase